MVELEGLVVDRRFRGPPDSANGGYVAGRLAAHLEGDVTVRLERPPPLERPLPVVRAEDGAVELRDGEALVARARPARLELQVPEPPSAEAIRSAAQGYRGFREHPFPGCFVCGPERAEGDGLRLFAGPVAGRSLAACPWVPDVSLTESDGTKVRAEFLWAALDCPGLFSFPQPANAMLLGELTARLDAEVRAGELCAVIGWDLEHRGRVHRTGTALFDSRGDCVARAAATWIEVPGLTPRARPAGSPVSSPP